MPYVTAIVGFVETAVVAVLGFYYDNSMKEKVARLSNSGGENMKRDCQEVTMFDIEKARKKGMNEKSIEIMERINENTRRRESCNGHDFEMSQFGKYSCKNCGCEEPVEYVKGYTDGLKHAGERK